MAKPIVANDEYPLSTNLGMQSQQALENGDADKARELSAQSHGKLRKESTSREHRRRALLDGFADERERRAQKLKPMPTHEKDYENER